MKQYNKICVFDLETDGVNPNVCSPIQIAALIVDPIKLEIVPNSEFNLMLKPDKLEDNPNHVYDTDILSFHAKVRGCDQSDILRSWKESISQKQGWSMFIDYLDKHHCRTTKKSQFSAPIAAGYNIHRFDLKIVQRLARKYGNVNKEDESNIFYPRDISLIPLTTKITTVVSSVISTLRQVKIKLSPMFVWYHSKKFLIFNAVYISITSEKLNFRAIT